MPANNVPARKNRSHSATVAEVLVRAKGFAPLDCYWVIRQKLFPLRHRVFDNLRLYITGDSGTAEWELVRDISRCRNRDDIYQAFGAYHANLLKMSGVAQVLLGGPNQKRITRFCSELWRQWEVDRTEQPPPA